MDTCFANRKEFNPKKKGFANREKFSQENI
jgi:hypothetical protein